MFFSSIEILFLQMSIFKMTLISQIFSIFSSSTSSSSCHELREWFPQLDRIVELSRRPLHTRGVQIGYHRSILDNILSWRPWQLPGDVLGGKKSGNEDTDLHIYRQPGHLRYRPLHAGSTVHPDIGAPRILDFRWCTMQVGAHGTLSLCPRFYADVHCHCTREILCHCLSVQVRILRLNLNVLFTITSMLSNFMRACLL